MAAYDQHGEAKHAGSLSLEMIGPTLASIEFLHPRGRRLLPVILIEAKCG